MEQEYDAMNFAFYGSMGVCDFEDCREISRTVGYDCKLERSLRALNAMRGEVVVPSVPARSDHFQRHLVAGRREGAVQRGKFVRRQANVERGPVLLHMAGRAGLRDRDQVLLAQHPCQGDLGRRGGMRVGDAPDRRVPHQPALLQR